MKLSENHNLIISQLFSKSVEKNSFTDSITSTAGDWKLLITCHYSYYVVSSFVPLPGGDCDLQLRE